MAVTAFHPGGYPGIPYGSFAGKESYVYVKSRGLRKTRYVPGRIPAGLGEAGRAIQEELEKINNGMESPFTHEILEVLSVEPMRKPVFSIMLAAADGTNWNPGSGRGLYLYYGGTWVLVKAF